MSEGRLDYSIRLDTDQLQRDAESSKKAFEDIGKSAADVGSTIDRSFNDKNFGGLYDMRESIKASQEYLQQLKDKYNEVANAMRNAPLGSDTSQLEADLQAVKTEIDEEEAALAGLQSRYDTISSQSVPSIRTQMRELQQTMMQLRLEGNQNTDTYRQLEQQLSRLATVQRQVNQERKMGSSGATDIAAWLQGVQGLAGAYTAASGVMSIFVKDQEKLMAIQTKLQSLMSILIGLQQVSNTLHSTSAFRLRALTTVQTAYNAVIAKTSTALRALGVSAAAADVAAKALTATLTLGLSIAITAVISLLNKFSDAQDQAAESAKKVVEFESSAREERIQAAAQLKTYIARIDKFNGTREQEQALLSELNQKYGETFGYYNTLTDWYDVLINKGKAYIDTLYRQAKAQALVTAAVEADQKVAEIQARGAGAYRQGVGARFLEGGLPAIFRSEEDIMARAESDYNSALTAAQYVRDTALKLATEEATAAQKINEEAGLGGYTRPSTPSTTPTRTTAIADNSEKEKKEREKAIKDTNSLILTLLNENEKAQVDIMEDGYQKQMAQLDYQYTQELAKIEDYREKFKELNETSGVAVGLDGLTDVQRDLLLRQEDLAYENRYKAQQALLAKNLQGIMTYSQEREKILKEYADKEESLYEHDEQGNRTGLREGVTQENVENLNANRDKDLQALGDAYLSREDWYQSFCNAITQLSLEKLKELLAMAQASLEEMKANGYSEEDIAKMEAMIRDIQEQTEKMETSPSKDSTNDWQKLYKTLNQCEKEFEKVGDSIGGTVGEIIKATGQITTRVLSMFNSLNNLTEQFKKTTDAVEDAAEGGVDIIKKTADTATTAVKKTADGTSKAIKVVEQASAILTVISAALSIATAIANLFNNDDKKQKQIENLQQQIDQLQWELDNTAAVRIQNQLGDALTVVRDIYAQTVKEIERMHSANSSYADSATKSMTRVQKETEAYNKSIQKIADTYANLEYTTTHVLGTEQYSNAREQLENYAEQLMLIQEQYDLENKKKKTDEQQLQEYQQQMDEIAEKMATLVDELVEDIIGGSAADIASQLGDAFVEAFQAGEDAAQAWGDTVDDIVSNIIKNMLITEILEPQIGKIFDEYEKMWYKNGQFQGTEAVIASMSSFADELNAVQNDFAAVWDALSEEMLDYFTTDSERTGVNQGIASASQESVDELNGRATAIQSHTYSINETTKSMLVTSNLILQSIVNIEGNTDGLSTRMATVESYVKEMRDTTNDMYRLGVKIR